MAGFELTSAPDRGRRNTGGAAPRADSLWRPSSPPRTGTPGLVLRWVTETSEPMGGAHDGADLRLRVDIVGKACFAAAGPTEESAARRWRYSFRARRRRAGIRRRAPVPSWRGSLPRRRKTPNRSVSVSPGDVNEYPTIPLEACRTRPPVTAAEPATEPPVEGSGLLCEQRPGRVGADGDGGPAHCSMRGTWARNREEARSRGCRASMTKPDPAVRVRSSVTP